MDKFLLIIAFVAFLCIGIGMTIFTFQECGAKALLYGNGASMAALTGACD